jgi:hypothetical protein
LPSPFPSALFTAGLCPKVSVCTLSDWSRLNIYATEHSHEKFLRSVKVSLELNNPDGILDPVFGLLGNAAAAEGAGNIAVRTLCFATTEED